MSSVITKKRCPAGYRIDIYGNCVKIQDTSVAVNAVEDTIREKTKKIRCPAGYRRDSAGNCIPISGSVADIPASLPPPPPTSMIATQENENVADAPQVSVSIPLIKPSTQKKRCPAGYRRDSAGNCVPIAGSSSIKPLTIKNRASSLVASSLRDLTLFNGNDGVNPVVSLQYQNNGSLENNIPFQQTEDVMPASVSAPAPSSPPTPPPPPIIERKKRKPAKVVAPSIYETYPENNPNNDMDFDATQLEPEHNLLYPQLDDPDFSYKIAKMGEFAYHAYEADMYPIEQRANALCKAKFELMPHQIFIKNFLSANTPYKGLLLYNMLGSGKTCTAIGVAEEMRQYTKKIGVREKILVVASPNVQGNFKLQLFDERRLKQIPNPANPAEFIWNIESCIGSSLLKEINPDNLHTLPRKTIITNINTLIAQTYAFMGYGQLGKFLELSMKKNIHLAKTEQEMREMEIKNIRRTFNNRLIIIDEVHNIRLADDNKNKTVASLLMKVAKYSVGLRLLLLSATPMFNSYREIIWITNLLNLNDKRSTVDVNTIFDNNGEFKKGTGAGLGAGTVASMAGEDGRDILARKLNGYISYVRGENPYSFPFRIYPDMFEPDAVFGNGGGLAYPTIQMNGKPISTPIKYVKVYCNRIQEDTYQHRVYKYVIHSMKTQTFDFVTNKGTLREMPTFENMEKFGYTILQTPLEALNMCYPIPEMETALLDFNASSGTTADTPEDVSVYQNSGKAIIQQAVGKRGLSMVMTYRITESPISLKSHFEYKPAVLAKYGRIFHRDNLYKYSHKIATICDYIRKSEGIILLYSQFINGGVIPLALALEEMGFARYSSETQQNLFKKAPTEPVDYLMRKRSELGDENEPFHQAKYIMITGDRGLSLNNNADVKYATNTENANGSRVKVIIISKTGSESIDFKNIRQVHILEPWYNMNRMEQIVGRGVRNLSHCGLPFEKRNVQIFYHGTVLPDGAEGANQEEPADLYVYRLAETKAVQIGQVARVLKEVAVDCVLNIGQSKFTVDRLFEIEENRNIKQQLATGKIVDFRVGDRPFTDVCDYMATCEYNCRTNKVVDMDKLNYALYNSDYAKMNIQHIATRIKDMFKERYVYKRDEIVKIVNYQKNYPIDEIFFTLTYFLSKNDTLSDEYGRIGYLVNRGEYYLFQPVELTNENATMLERTVPIEYKRNQLMVEVPTQFTDRPIGEPMVDEFAQTGREFGETVNGEPKINMGMGVGAIGMEKGRTYQTILDEMTEQLNTATRAVYEISAKDKDWFKHCATVYEHLKTVYRISPRQLNEYVVYHSLDILTDTDKLILLGELYGGVHIATDETRMGEEEVISSAMFIEKTMRKYFDEKMRILDDGRRGILLAGDSSISLYIKSGISSGEDVLWEKGDDHDVREFGDEMASMYINPRKMNDLVGFIADFKGKECVFKVKNITQKRNNVGAKCDNAGKLDIIKFLNEIVGMKDIYTTDNVVNIKQPGLCVMLEIIMREYSRVGKNGKVFFMDAESAILSNVAQL